MGLRHYWAFSRPLAESERDDVISLFKLLAGQLPGQELNPARALVDAQVKLSDISCTDVGISFGYGEDDFAMRWVERQEHACMANGDAYDAVILAILMMTRAATNRSFEFGSDISDGSFLWRAAQAIASQILFQLQRMKFIN